MWINGHKITGVIFDIDGTLVDSFPVYCSVFNQGIAKYQLGPVSKEYLVNALKRGDNLIDIFRNLFPQGTDDSFLQKFRKEVLDLFLKAEVTEVKLFPGTHELFKHLIAKGIKIGVATGRTTLPELEWSRFKRYGLDGYIDALVTSREVEKRKPAPDAILECAKRLGIPIENCLVVGDTEADIQATRSAGGISVAVTTGGDDAEILKRENPGLIFKSLIDLDLFVRAH